VYAPRRRCVHPTTTWLLPRYLLGLVGSVAWTIAEDGYSNDWLTYEPAATASSGVPGWWCAYTIYMGVWVVTMMAWDFARFGKPADAVAVRRWAPRNSVPAGCPRSTPPA
jgi:hypothetical protein